MIENILGRQHEKDLLQQIYDSKFSEFVAVCGRRRVGKTFLIREYFEECISFQAAGLAQGDTKKQLRNFHSTLCRYTNTKSEVPNDWLDAFEMLIDYLESLPQKRKVVFLDELPWMDTPTSDFISALEHFWNGWASARHDVVLIVCGSATSWMMDKLINNHGGLYGRLTQRIFLQPFSLAESEEFVENRGLHLSRYELAECYMIFGGIPYYLNFLDARLSLAQNVDRLLFNPNGELYDEFNKLYASLFRNSDVYICVVEALSGKGYGMTRTEICEATKLKSGKGLSEVLSNLESCGFIRQYYNYGATSSRNAIYQLVDFFTLFYFRFLRGSTFKSLKYWSQIQHTPKFYAWAGPSFEILSLLHIEKIKQKLGISGILTNAYSWRSKNSENGAQIDLVLERGDNTINLCEMKFVESEYQITKSEYENLQNKVHSFISESKTRKSIQVTLVSTYGVKQNSYSNILQNDATLSDLF